MSIIELEIKAHDLVILSVCKTKTECPQDKDKVNSRKFELDPKLELDNRTEDLARTGPAPQTSVS